MSNNNYWFTALNACFEWMLQFQTSNIRIYSNIRLFKYSTTALVETWSSLWARAPSATGRLSVYYCISNERPGTISITEFIYSHISRWQDRFLIEFLCCMYSLVACLMWCTVHRLLMIWFKDFKSTGWCWERQRHLRRLVRLQERFRFLTCWSVPEIFAIKVERCQKRAKFWTIFFAVTNVWGPAL